MEKNTEVFSNERNRNRALIAIFIVLWIVLLFTTFIILNKLNIEFIGVEYHFRFYAAILGPLVVSAIICFAGAFDGLLLSWYPDLEIELSKTKA